MAKNYDSFIENLEGVFLSHQDYSLFNKYKKKTRSLQKRKKKKAKH